MKSLHSITQGIAMAFVSLFALSCTRDIPQVATVQPGMENAAAIQIFNATVKAARNYVYVDGIPVSGIAIASGGIFPATAYAFKVSPGVHSILIKDTLPGSTQTPLTFSQTVDAGKSYTIFTYDTITSVKQLTITNNIVITKDTTAMFRFANFVYNSTAVPAVDVYSFRKGTTTPLFSNVPTAQVTDFIPYLTGQTDTLYVYPTGTKTPLLVKQLVPSLTPSRSYTAAYNGSFSATKAISVFATY